MATELEPNGRVPVRRALLSVTDKRGLVELARGLAGLGAELVSTGGTARALREAGLAVRDVSDVTGHPEILGGRVKSLHPKVHGGILARLPGDEAELAACGIEPFDLVAVNLYRFEEAAAAGRDLDALVEEIDVGGPTLLRAAGKAHARVAVLSDPGDYEPVLAELRAHGGTSLAARQRLAVAAFQRTAAYDAAIATGLGARLGAASDAAALPERLCLAGTRVGGPLRYGENPHQRGALYRAGRGGGVADLRVLPGGEKELSYTNLLDVDAALALSWDLGGKAACVVKHAGPCGAASGADALAALELAWAGDPLSAFGSVVGLNVPCDEALARALAEKPFLEAVVVPAFAPEAGALLRGRKGWGKTVRLLEATMPAPSPASPALDVRAVLGGFLVQDRDVVTTAARWEPVTKRAPDAEEERALRFAWSCVRHVRSNAIVLAQARADGLALVGVGGGQPSRVDSVELAARKAGARARGAVLASDAFFPFPDGVEAAHAAGVRAVVQPGGSKKDDEVVARADALGIAMVFTGTRAFRH